MNNRTRKTKQKNNFPILVLISLVISVCIIVGYKALPSEDNLTLPDESSTSENSNSENSQNDTSGQNSNDDNSSSEESDQAVAVIPQPELSYPYDYSATQNFDVYTIPRSDARVIDSVKTGDIIKISSLTTNVMEGVDTPDMVKITTSSGNIGFVEPSFIEQDLMTELCELDGFVSKTATTEADAFNVFDEKYLNLSIDEKFGLLKEWFPKNRNWNTIGFNMEGIEQDYAVSLITDTACNHGSTAHCHEYDGETLDEFGYSTNIQCLGFASMVSDFLFGKETEITIFKDMDKIQVGDHIRYTKSTHSMIVTEVDEGGFRVVEVNSDYKSCKINWDRYLSKEELAKYAFEVLSRY